MSWVELTFKW